MSLRSLAGTVPTEMLVNAARHRRMDLESIMLERCVSFCLIVSVM